MHTLPMMPELLLVFSWYIGTFLNQAPLALGMIVRGSKGLRPSELSNLTKESIFAMSTAADNRLVINLGTRVRPGKSCREQAVWISSVAEPLAFYCLKMLAPTCDAGQRLVGIAYHTYYNVLKRAVRALNTANYSCHSPRAGWATAQHIAGVNFGDLKEAGRWEPDASCRWYIDVISTLGAAPARDLKNLASTAAALVSHFYELFPWSKV